MWGFETERLERMVATVVMGNKGIRPAVAVVKALELLEEIDRHEQVRKDRDKAARAVYDKDKQTDRVLGRMKKAYSAGKDQEAALEKTRYPLAVGRRGNKKRLQHLDRQLYSLREELTLLVRQMVERRRAIRDRVAARFQVDAAKLD